MEEGPPRGASLSACPSLVVDVPPEAPPPGLAVCSPEHWAWPSRACLAPLSPEHGYPTSWRAFLSSGHVLCWRRNSPRTPWGWRCPLCHPYPGLALRVQGGSPPGGRLGGPGGAGSAGPLSQRSGSGDTDSHDASATFLGPFSESPRPAPQAPSAPRSTRSCQNFRAFGGALSWGSLSPHPARAHNWMACLMASLGPGHWRAWGRGLGGPGLGAHTAKRGRSHRKVVRHPAACQLHAGRPWGSGRRATLQADPDPVPPRFLCPQRALALQPSEGDSHQASPNTKLP